MTAASLESRGARGRTSLLVTGAGAAVLALGLGACGSSTSGLSGNTSCSDFLKAPADQQAAVVNTLAAKHKLPDYSGALGLAEITYECSAVPNNTLEQRYAHAAAEYGGVQ